MNHCGRMVVAIGLLGASSATVAQTMPPLGTYPQPPWYFGVGVGSGHLNRSGTDLTGLDNADLDRQDTTWTVRGGWRFSPFGAIEVGYYDFGRYDFHGPTVVGQVPVSGSAKAHSVGISLVGIIPIQQFDLYGRIGYAHSELKFNANTELINRDHNDRQDEAIYGLGARWNFAPNWGLFAEWAKNDRIRIDSYLGGIDFRF